MGTVRLTVTVGGGGGNQGGGWGSKGDKWGQLD